MLPCSVSRMACKGLRDFGRDFAESDRFLEVLFRVSCSQVGGVAGVELDLDSRVWRSTVAHGSSRVGGAPGAEAEVFKGRGPSPTAGIC